MSSVCLDHKQNERTIQAASDWGVRVDIQTYISKSSKLTRIDSIFAVYSHNSVQGLSGSFTLPCFTICKATHANPKVWTLVFINANTRLAYVSNTQQLSPTTTSTFLYLWEPSSRTQPHVLVCVCAVLPPLFHHMYTVCAPGFTSVRCVQSPCCPIGSSLYKKYRERNLHQIIKIYRQNTTLE